MKDPYNNYQNRFISLANLNIGNLPKVLEFQGDKFVVKPEFHITLLAVEQIAKIIDSDNAENLKLAVVKEFYDFVNALPLTQYELSDDLRFVRVGANKTIVIIAKVKNIDRLFERLSKKYGVQLPVQPTHVTLYTLPTDTFGIPINSHEELKKISKPVEIPELRAAF